MYSAPNLIVVHFDESNNFASGHCNPGTEVHNVDFGGSDLTGCQPLVIEGQVSETQCYFMENP